MENEKLLLTVKSLSVDLRIFDGRLETRNLNQLDKETIQQLKRHEQEVIQLLCNQNPEIVIPEFSKPYLKENGELIIPSNCHPKYKFWLRTQESPWTPITKSQTLRETLIELSATEDVLNKYCKSK